MKKSLEEVLTDGTLYDPMPLMSSQSKLLKLNEEYNALGNSDENKAKRDALLEKMLKHKGKNVCIMAPFYSLWSLKRVSIGDYSFVNVNSSFLDDGEIIIGDYCLIGSGVSLVTPQHPLSPSLRKKGLEYNKTVRLGNNVWVGSGAIICPGVTIGDNVVIGAGSVVTKDIPDNSIAVGNPARVLRKVTPEDDIYYDHGKIVKDNLVDIKEYLK